LCLRHGNILTRPIIPAKRRPAVGSE
jgi:hypothetical protein